MKLAKRLVVFLLTWEARMVLRRYNPRVIAVTGSVGKTTTKDAIYAVLSKTVSVRKSVKSFNSELGVPLTILGLDNAWNNPFKWIWNILCGLWIVVKSHEYPSWLVLEVGADRPGDIYAIARWLKPDIVVFTLVPDIPVHVEYFDSPESVLREKRALVEHLKLGGTLVINGDDERTRGIARDFRGAAVTYGLSEKNNFSASHSEIIYDNNLPAGLRFRLSFGGSSVPVTVYGALGMPRVYSALAAIAVAHELDIDVVSASNTLAQWEAPPGRMRILPGVRGSIILDDTYNSSPAAVIAALETLKSITTTGRRIAVLGDMLELGKYSVAAHRSAGEKAAHCADVLMTVGFRARAIGEAAIDAGIGDGRVSKYEHDEAARAGLELERVLQKGDIVLVKGSQALRMERTVAAILSDPTQAPTLLVRQDDAWTLR